MGVHGTVATPASTKSDILHKKTRNELLESTKYKTKEARFWEHDELRYSFRAARNATASWRNSTWHVITADVPDPRTNMRVALHKRRLGLVPQWLDIECALHRGIGVHSPDAQGCHSLARKILPSFNSVALNNDQFMLLPLPPSAFHTTLYSQVFRVDPYLLVDGDDSGSSDWGDQRFGTRQRAYTPQCAGALSLPLMHEASLAFGAYFAATPLSQFRGSHMTPTEYEVNAIFISTHCVIERHREALLSTSQGQPMYCISYIARCFPRHLNPT
ncbi:hypothetical protein B0H14DRAFT_2571824 [Mycena olivaceomarginata]|nr:hypothetical protein B0H14DRAFT_2571824 [Mycena olivaceomarginata]